MGSGNQKLLMKNQFESTYALIVRSEEKSRSVLEVVLYAFFILSAVLSILQFAQNPVKIPAAGLERSASYQIAAAQDLSQS